MSDRIARVGLTHLQIPLKEPFRIAGGEVAIKDAILVEVETAAGAVGLGESSPMAASFGYSIDTPEGCWNDLVGTIVPDLLGSEPSSIEAIGERAGRWASCSRFAVAGAETALWDLLGQARSLSIAELMGAAPDMVERGVESGLAVGLYDHMVDLLRAIETHMTEGYRRIKVKISPGHDVEIVRTVRQHFGDVPLMVDANASFGPEHADVFHALDEFDLDMIEQPLAAGDLEGMARLQSAISTPICIDESAHSLAQTARAIEIGACRIVNIKIQRVGGFGPALAIHEHCRERGVACWVGTMPELGIGQAQGLHLSAMANCKYPTDVEPSARWFVDDYVVPMLELASPGLFRVPSRPGLGFQVDPVKVRHYQIRHEDFFASAV